MLIIVIIKNLAVHFGQLFHFQDIYYLFLYYSYLFPRYKNKASGVSPLFYRKNYNHDKCG